MVLLLLAIVLIPIPDPAGADGWPHWRGPGHNGASGETGLVSAWSRSGSGLLWSADFSGRSTPILMNGRVYVIGRVGEGITEQERIACFDAGTGALLWEDRLNVFHTTIPFNRVGWANLAGDPETGNVYAHGVQGIFNCYSGDGELLWSRSLTEEFGRISGYGGRTHTPFVDGDLVVISFLNSSWGDQAVPRHRYFAFDKNGGEVVWVSTPGGRPLDTTYSTPVAAEVGGQRLLIAGNADGAVYALRAATGEKVWGFRLSKRGINVSVVAGGGRVYVSHSEENVDNTVMGRVVCIDATGTGDVTGTGEIWRRDASLAGYASPALDDGRLYVVDNSANLLCLDAGDGTLLWERNIGTVGRGSPVVADGKIYVATVNGRFEILQPGEGECLLLDEELLAAEGGRPLEIYGSPAVAWGCVYFATENGLFCLGDSYRGPSTSAPSGSSAAPPGAPVPANNPPASIQLVPAEVLLAPGESARFAARLSDAAGRLLSDAGAGPQSVDWSLEELAGEVEAEDAATALFTAVPEVSQTGLVSASLRFGPEESAALAALSRVRVAAERGWSEDFESLSATEGENAAPAHWIGSARKFFVRELDGNKVLAKPLAKRGLQRSNVYIGPPGMSGYTIQADMMAARGKRNRPDMGLIANRYTLDMMGNHQRLQIRSWASDLRMAKTIDFEWEPEVWYTVRMTVDVEADRAVVKGKVWRRGEDEPQDWTIEAEDPLPNRNGSPGIYGYSAAEIFYDNVRVW